MPQCYFVKLISVTVMVALVKMSFHRRHAHGCIESDFLYLHNGDGGVSTVQTMVEGERNRTDLNSSFFLLVFRELLCELVAIVIF